MAQRFRWQREAYRFESMALLRLFSGWLRGFSLFREAALAAFHWIVS